MSIAFLKLNGTNFRSKIISAQQLEDDGQQQNSASSIDLSFPLK